MEYDSVSGQYYDRARYYNAVTVRFIGQDPMGFAAGNPNLHGYVGDSPTNGTDPTGMTGSGGQAAAWTLRRSKHGRPRTPLRARVFPSTCLI